MDIPAQAILEELVDQVGKLSFDLAVARATIKTLSAANSSTNAPSAQAAAVDSAPEA